MLRDAILDLLEKINEQKEENENAIMTEIQLKEELDHCRSELAKKEKHSIWSILPIASWFAAWGTEATSNEKKPPAS